MADIVDYGEDVKTVMQRNKDKLFCAECNCILEMWEEPMVRIRHFSCPNCKKDIAGQAYEG